MFRAFLFLTVALATTVVAEDDFAEGQRLYVARCVVCHERQQVAIQPVNSSSRGLRDAVNKMAQRAGLDYQDVNEVIFYLEAVRMGRAKLPVRNSPTTGTTDALLSGNQLATAQQWYTVGCGRCHTPTHRPIQPSQFNQASLKLWMDKMAPLSKFTSNQTAQVGAYLEAVRTGKAKLPTGTGTTTN